MEEVLVVLVESVHNISVHFHHISLTQLYLILTSTGMKAKILYHYLANDQNEFEALTVDSLLLYC